MKTQTRPLLQTQNHDSNLAARKILLIAHVLVGCEQYFESIGFGDR
jgi:hypothetical protein